LIKHRLMKRTLTFIVCLILLQIVKADALSVKVVGSTQKNTNDTSYAHAANAVILNGYGPIVKRRLDSIKKDVPLDYNEYVQTYIDSYTGRRDEMAQIIGLSKYYFPIYEKAFHTVGIPEEIKYLSIVESELNPNAVSRVGATGPWQFMTTTAKLYGLNMDGYVDERRDPIRASYAAAAYLKDAYEEFGDWLLAIASYNCGKSSVESAIAQAGGANDFWSIRQYLPAETRGYVPAYIAVAYVMNYYKKHNIVPQACNMAMNIDTILVDKYVSLHNVSNVLGIGDQELALLNPAYKIQVINGTSANPRKLILPQISKDKYAALYDALNNNQAGYTLPKASYNRYNDDGPHQRAGHRKNKQDEYMASAEGRHNRHYVTYKVKAGDTLRVIASKFDGASVERIRSLNGLGNEQLQPGMTLKISKG